MTDLQRLAGTRKAGTEAFRSNGNDLGFDLLSFWQWSVSDLVSNATRGILAEYIVARALGLSGEGIRDEWAAFDLETTSGIKVEVKSAAYVQSWHQERLSRISFAAPKTRAWDADTNTQSSATKRQADVYVFALLYHTDKETIDPMNLDQWRFYVVPTAVLDARMTNRHSISLKSLEQLCAGAVTYSDLRQSLEGKMEEERCRTALLS